MASISMEPGTSSERKLTWLITGCSSGFGLALARLAQANGHKVIATSRNPSRMPDLVEEITKNGGEWIRLDQEEKECGRVIEEVEARGQAIDVLANSAGIGMAGPVEFFTEEEVRHVMETNFFGPYRLMRAAAPYMRKRRSGVIVNFSSGSGVEARQSLGVYGASKAALDGITKTFHQEMQDFNVRVVLLHLGAFNTPMVTKVAAISKSIYPEYKDTITEKFYTALSTGDFAIHGDHVKATQAIYDVVMGKGIGEGHEKEMILPLGRDLAERIREHRDRIDHMMEVFGEICNNVDVDTPEAP
ncbi:putative short-chain oxidoreductase [Daldinia caldariorum]|uniref:putative short-chain oxidoreductase n=1 Tax=Daldinia caldariorum TaxID=326644 RepID=UPI002007CEAD|nr:putative short-chain oxidoreductase [Daldinia caldariorum]KAI1468307.1 putative short-chain oxidoreductase [Daldinia caldariorum]